MRFFLTLMIISGFLLSQFVLADDSSSRQSELSIPPKTQYVKFAQHANKELPIEEVLVVSGRSKPVALRDVAVSADVLQQDQLTAIAATHPNEWAVAVPNTWVSRGSGQEHLTAIRSPVFTGPGACGNFLMAEEGIALRANGFCNTNQLFDSFYEVSESIEVFRGPNSSVLGGNALFGGVHLSTPDFIGELDASASNRENTLTIASNTVQQHRFSWVSKGRAVSHFGSLHNDRGYRYSAGVNQQKVGLKWRSQHGRWQQQSLIQLNNLSQETAGFIFGEDAHKDSTQSRSNPNPNAYRDARSIRGQSQWHSDLNTNQRITVTPYFRANRMDFLMHFLAWQPVEENGHQSMGVNAVMDGENGRWSWEVGSHLAYTQGFLKETQSEPSPFAQQRFPTGTHYDYTVDATELAAFAYTAYALSTQHSLSANIRWDSLHYDYRNQVPAGSACAPEVMGCRFYRPASRSDRFSEPSVRLAWQWHPLDSHQIFMNVANGFRAPQATELYRLQAPAQSNQAANVSLKSIELGVRANKQNWQYGLSVFAMAQQDGIFQDADRNFISGADTDHQGIEYSFGYQWPVFSIKAAGSFNRHEYANSPSLLGIGSVNGGNIKGNDIDTAPRQLHHLTLSWQQSLKNRWQMRLSYHDDYFLEPENQHSYEGHQLLDISWRHQLSQKSTLTIAINNLLDSAYAERADFAFGNYRYFPGLPRRLEIRWQLQLP